MHAFKHLLHLDRELSSGKELGLGSGLTGNVSADLGRSGCGGSGDEERAIDDLLSAEVGDFVSRDCPGCLFDDKTITHYLSRSQKILDSLVYMIVRQDTLRLRGFERLFKLLDPRFIFVVGAKCTL